MSGGEELRNELRAMLSDPMPLPGGGATAVRHHRLLEIGRASLPLARLAEAHWDAVAILAEAGRPAEPGLIYGVWASERAGSPLRLEESRGGGLAVWGTKGFCSGAGLVDRALVTAGGLLVDLDLRGRGEAVQFDDSGWLTTAFAETRTAEATFTGATIEREDVVGGPGWYVGRPGFWHGACGPAACWAGGAASLLDYARGQSRTDAHTMAHLGAMEAAVWAMRACLQKAGEEIDHADGDDAPEGVRRALSVRHVVEEFATDVLRRIGRAYGPHPLAMDADTSRRYADLQLYVRQCHAERDLEALGRLVHKQRPDLDL